MVRTSRLPYLQYPPRVVLVIGDAAVALPSVHEAWVDARVVHGRCAGVQLTARNKLVDVGSIAAVVLLGLLLTPSAKEKPHASRNGEKSNNAHNNAGCDACCVGLALFFWSSRGCARGCLRRCCSGGCRARRFRGSARRGLEVFDLVQCFSGKDNPEFRGSTACVMLAMLGEARMLVSYTWLSCLPRSLCRRYCCRSASPLLGSCRHSSS